MLCITWWTYNYYRCLVELLKDDDLILSVIAHEIAHIKERHSLQQIVEIAGLSSIAWMIFGLDESILEEIVFIGINIWGLKKSRDLEKDADIIALKLLEKLVYQNKFYTSDRKTYKPLLYSN